MMKALLTTLTLAASSTLMPASAGAFPLDHGLAPVATATSRWFAGFRPGQEFSEALVRCIVDTRAARRRDVRRDVRAATGLRWSDRLARCV